MEKEKIEKKILGVSAAPTKNSRSEHLLNSFLSGASFSGAQVEKIFVRDLKISFCDGFRGCERKGFCKFNDDMRIVEKAVLSSDIVVVSSPIYFTSLPAKLKAVIDRCQVYWARKNILKNEVVDKVNETAPRCQSGSNPKKGFFISVAGSKTTDFGHAEAMIRAFFSVFNIKLCGKFYLPGTDKITYEQFAEALEEVSKLGKEVSDESDC